MTTWLQALIYGLISLLRWWLRPRPTIGSRSSRWPAVRNAHLKRFPACSACGSKEHLNVHHRIPVSVRPELELAPDNMITLCEGPTNCHYLFGHLRDWKSWNLDVDKDAAYFLAKIKTRPYKRPVTGDDSRYI